MIDINKKYRTLQGWPVTIYSTIAPGPYPVHGMWVRPCGSSTLFQADCEGSVRYSATGSSKILEVKTPESVLWEYLNQRAYTVIGDLYSEGMIDALRKAGMIKEDSDN